MIRILLALLLVLSPVAASAAPTGNAVHDWWTNIWTGLQGGKITNTGLVGGGGNQIQYTSIGNRAITSGPVEIGNPRTGAYIRMGTQGLKGATAIFKLNGKTFSMVKVPDNREIVESAHIDVKAGDKMEVKIVDIDPKADDVKWKVNCLYDVKKRPAGQKASTSNASMEVKADARKPNKAKNQREQKRDRHEAKGGKGKR